MPRKRIKRGPIKKKTKGRIPSIEEPAHDDRLRMSFRRLDTAKADFSPDLCGDGYLRCFVERLRDVCHLTVHEFTTNLSKSLRIHPIDFDKTSQKAGFDHLNEQLRDLPCPSSKLVLFEISHLRRASD